MILRPPPVFLPRVAAAPLLATDKHVANNRLSSACHSCFSALRPFPSKDHPCRPACPDSTAGNETSCRLPLHGFAGVPPGLRSTSGAFGGHLPRMAARQIPAKCSPFAPRHKPNPGASTTSLRRGHASAHSPAAFPRPVPTARVFPNRKACISRPQRPFS